MPELTCEHGTVTVMSGIWTVLVIGILAGVLPI